MFATIRRQSTVQIMHQRVVEGCFLKHWNVTAGKPSTICIGEPVLTSLKRGSGSGVIIENPVTTGQSRRTKQVGASSNQNSVYGD